MESENDLPLRPGHQRYDEVIALENAVRATRKATGRKNPEDCVSGTPEWDAVTEDFVRELLWTVS
jgi:hypothetical protein